MNLAVIREEGEIDRPLDRRGPSEKERRSCFSGTVESVRLSG